jgi:hypothetical protein
MYDRLPRSARLAKIAMSANKEETEAVIGSLVTIDTRPADWEMQDSAAASKAATEQANWVPDPNPTWASGA